VIVLVIWIDVVIGMGMIAGVLRTMTVSAMILMTTTITGQEPGRIVVKPIQRPIGTSLPLVTRMYALTDF
jgi:hypothetical protein